MGDERASDFAAHRRRELGLQHVDPARALERFGVRNSTPQSDVEGGARASTTSGARAPMPDDRSRVVASLATREREEQKLELERVSTRIAGSILAFFATRIGVHFHADELRRHVAGQCGNLAPGSADRVMRDLRARGSIAYRVVNRAQSLYLGLDPKSPKGDHREKAKSPEA